MRSQIKVLNPIQYLAWLLDVVDLWAMLGFAIHKTYFEQRLLQYIIFISIIF